MSSRAVVFENDGLIPIEAFTHSGLSSKPSTNNPIGKFGTGLKYAVAVLCREGIDVEVYIGLTKHSFYTKTREFRGNDFQMIRMKVEKFDLTRLGRPKYHELPYSTHYGHGWELWQAYRELHANTLDENGIIRLAEEEVVPETGKTKIVVYGERFVSEFLDRDRTFLPDGLTVRETVDGVQVMDRPSRHVYYRGLRVHDLENPSQMTYNFLREIQLTEDRTAKDVYLLESYIRNHLVASQDKEVIRKVLTAPRDSYESRMYWDSTYVPPSKEFIEVLHEVPTESVPESARAYVKQYEPKAPIADPFGDFPRPWHVGEVVNGEFAIFDNKGKTIPPEALRIAARIVNDFAAADREIPGTDESVAYREYDETLPLPQVASPDGNDDEIPF